MSMFFYMDVRKRYLHSDERRFAKYERKLNQRIGATHMAGRAERRMTLLRKCRWKRRVQQFSALDEYIEAFNTFDVRKLAQSSSAGGVYVPVSEVKHVGTFVSGEQIFFSKYYSAVVFDSMAGNVIEKSPEQLRPGDVLVFVKRDDYTKNIVDVHL